MSGLTREQAEGVLRGLRFAELEHAQGRCASQESIIASMMGEPQKKPRRMKANTRYRGELDVHKVEHDENEACRGYPACVPVDAPQEHPIKTGFIPSTPPRDWTKEVEVGDEVVFDDRVLRGVVRGPMCCGSYPTSIGEMADDADLFRKRPDRPGDGFEIIGREREGVFRWEGTVADHGKGLLLMYTFIDRSKLRRVYAVRD